MISNVCAFLLCCFALTSNIKTIESAGSSSSKIYAGPFLYPIVDENYVRAVNNTRTFNKHTTIVITLEDESILSISPTNLLEHDSSIEEYELKLKSWDKLVKKARDIICSFCVIAQSNMLDLKNIVEELKNGKPFIDNENTIKRLKQEAEMIFIQFPFENLQMGKWFWSYFLKVIAVRHYDDNKDFIHKNPFDDHQLLTDVSHFIGTCIAEKYLPPTAIEPDFVSKNMDMNDNMFTDLNGSEWFIGRRLDGQYDSLIEFLYLKPFWDDESQLLFKEIAPGVNVDWSMIRQRHQDEVVDTIEFVKSRAWIYKPYGRYDHQHMVVKIIDARFYCYISVLLYLYEKHLTMLGLMRLSFLKRMIYFYIHQALDLSVKDEFLVFILSELQLAKTPHDINDIFVRVRAEAYGILKDLNGVNSNEIDWLSFNFNVNQLSTDTLITTMCEDFYRYILDLRIHMSLEYKILLHFMDVVRLSSARFI